MNDKDFINKILFVFCSWKHCRT